MATLKFEVGKVYITMADKFGDGEQTGKSVVIERTEGTVTFKHLASGEIFVREVQVFDAVQVEGCDGLDAMDNFIADNFGEEITTADIEPIEQVAEIESVENTAETETVVESVAEVETADDTVESVESAVETSENTTEPEKAKVEVCKAYDAKDIIAACYPVEIAERKVISKSKVDFFQGRLEKISNGQRDFLKDTQRQAVEILGKEIPPEVYNAVNPYKGFMMWLGLKVNPVIEYDDGAKMEICVDVCDNNYKVKEIVADEKDWVAEWEKESNAILKKTVFAALKNGHTIKLYKQGCTDFKNCIELLDCYTLTEKDAEIPRTFCSDKCEDGGEVTFTPVNPEGVSHTLALYKDKEQFETAARELAEAIERDDKEFIFPTVEELVTLKISKVAA